MTNIPRPRSRTHAGAGAVDTRGRTLLALATLAALAGVVPTALAQPGAPASTAGAVLLVVERFEVTGDNPLGAPRTTEVLRAHLGEHRSLDTLEAAAAALESALREQGYAFHRVVLPAQRPQGGVVRLDVLRFTLGEVRVSGNEFFSADNVRRSLPVLQPGSTPDVSTMSRQISLANEHPVKRVNVTLRESKAADAVDAEVQVRDARPLQVFATLLGNSRDEYNLINRNTGYTRLTLGVQHSNLFDRDHAATFAYTTSPTEPQAVSQYAGYYAFPLYGASGQVSAYYLYSDTNTGSLPVGGQPFNVRGQGTFFGLKYTATLPRAADMTQLVSVAIDERDFRSQVDASGVPLPGNPVVTRPVSFRYQARAERAWGGATGYVEYAVNAGGSSSAEFAAARNGASSNWDAWRGGLDASYAAGTWVLASRLRGQYSADLLVSGEQFGLGGATSVRGLREREYGGERGFTLTLEGTGPALFAGVRPALFVDHGYAYLRQGPNPVPGALVGGLSATSAGIGARWNWQRSLDVSADLAYVIRGLPGTTGTPGTPDGFVKLHFTGTWRF